MFLIDKLFRCMIDMQIYVSRHTIYQKCILNYASFKQSKKIINNLNWETNLQ